MHLPSERPTASYSLQHGSHGTRTLTSTKPDTQASWRHGDPVSQLKSAPLRTQSSNHVLVPQLTRCIRGKMQRGMAEKMHRCSCECWHEFMTEWQLYHGPLEYR